jgi:hypothetical protein
VRCAGIQRGWQFALVFWVALTLSAAPLLAAFECRECCDFGEPVAARAACPAATSEDLPECCRQHAASNPIEPRNQCPQCPVCEAKRPAPAIAGKNSSWKPPFAAVDSLAAVSVERPQPANVAWSSGREIIDRATPPPRVLFCSWQK